MKKPIFTLLLIVLVTILSVFTLEWLVRIVFPVYDPSGMIEFYRSPEGIPLGIKKSTLRQWKNTGDYNVAVRINEYGFREGKDLKSSTEGDIFVVGDSFAFGWGVEEKNRFSNLLEKKLGTSIYNIGVASADIGNYQKVIKYAQDNGATVKDVIVGVCMENDLGNYRPAVAKPRTGKRQPGPNNGLRRKFTEIKKWLAKHSAIYHAFLSVVHQNEFLKEIAMKRSLIIDNYDAVQNRKFSEEAIEGSSEKLLEIAKPFHSTILIIPSRGLWVGKNKDTEKHIHDEFVASLKRRGLNVVDLRPAFEGGGNPLQYHFKNDGHWNEKGHKKAAQAIYEAIKK